jgi:hypothetical protein
MNDLQYNQRLSSAKPVKVCQSDCVGLQSASRRRAGAALWRAAKAEEQALHRFSLRFMPPAFSLIRGQKIKVVQGGSSWIKVAQGILKHFFYAKL